MRRLHALAVFATAGLLASGCNLASDAVSVDPRDVVQLSTSTTTAPADGATRVAITVTIPASLDPASRTVTLSSTLGRFSTSSSGQLLADADSEGKVHAELVAPTQPGTAHIQARAGAHASTASVSFVHAFPDRVDVDPGGFSLSASSFSSTTVTATLRRGNGTASEQTIVGFTATDAGGGNVGSFTAIARSDASGVATARWSPGETSYRGRVLLTARVADSSGRSVQGSAVIDVVD